MKKVIFISVISLIVGIMPANSSLAETDLASRLSGRILLQVESRGEAWYVNPSDQERYYLGRPADALALMQQAGLGITNENLSKIPVNIVETQNFASLSDSDGDGLNNSLEEALGTDPDKIDTDGDGYDDKKEIISQYNPLGPEKSAINLNFSRLQAGKILLQVESQGEAWYVSPTNAKRYYLGRPEDAFALMKKLGLGITNADLWQLPAGSLPQSTTQSSNQTGVQNYQNTENAASPSSLAGGAVISNAAGAIRAKDIAKTLTYFAKEAAPAVEYTVKSLTDEGRLLLGNILSGSSLAGASGEEQIYSNEVDSPVDGGKIKINFRLKKQTDGSWLIANL